MLSNFVDKIIGLKATPAPIINVGGREYSTITLTPIKEPLPGTISVSTLRGLCDFIENNIDNIDSTKAFILIDSYLTVELYGPLIGQYLQRPMYAKASIDQCKFSFGDYMNIEQFIINLQSMFIPTPERDSIIKLISNLKAETQVTVADDGISQEVTAKTGIAKVEQVKAPNPVVLKPIRTFLEVNQPASSFIFRVRKPNDVTIQCALFEADGGAWKIEAMQNIEEYLNDILKGDIPIIT